MSDDLSEEFPPDAPGADPDATDEIPVPDEAPDREGTPFEDVDVDTDTDTELTEAEDVLQEMLAIERAAAAFYADLLERVKATPELADHVDEIEDMAIEEAEHAEMVEELLEERGIKVVVEE